MLLNVNSTWLLRHSVSYYKYKVKKNQFTFIILFIMFIQKFVEVPNTNIREEVLNDFGFDLCYDMAQQYGHAQLVWYALNGKRVVDGEYTDQD